MTPEGKVKADIKIALHNHGCLWFMPVQNGMGEATLDFLCWCSGRGFAIEAKAPGGRVTARQRHTMKKYERHGVKCFVCDGNIEELNQWLKELTSESAPSDES